jgi:hypothetical protein
MVDRIQGAPNPPPRCSFKDITYCDSPEWAQSLPHLCQCPSLQHRSRPGRLRRPSAPFAIPTRHIITHGAPVRRASDKVPHMSTLLPTNCMQISSGGLPPNMAATGHPTAMRGLYESQSAYLIDEADNLIAGLQRGTGLEFSCAGQMRSTGRWSPRRPAVECPCVGPLRGEPRGSQPWEGNSSLPLLFAPHTGNWMVYIWDKSASHHWESNLGVEI